MSQLKESELKPKPIIPIQTNINFKSDFTPYLQKTTKNKTLKIEKYINLGDDPSTSPIDNPSSFLPGTNLLKNNQNVNPF